MIEENRMKLKIEKYCIRCGVSVEACPELFEIDEKSCLLQLKCEDEIPEKLKAGALKAVRDCAVGAIAVIQ